MDDQSKAILVRYGEVWLKSDSVRRQFERILARNIRSLFPSDIKVTVVPGRTWIHSSSIPKELSRVFGIVSYSPVLICERNMDSIKSSAKQITSKWKSGTFAIRARRTDKSFPLNSKQIEIAVAELVKLPVDLSNPKHTLTIEIRDNAYLFERTVAGPGGMPLGSAGRVVAQLRDDDDIMAVWMVMKRGALPILLKPKPSLQKIVQKWAIGTKLKVVKSVKEAVKLHAISIVDARSKKSRESGLVVLNPLVGFSADETEHLRKMIRE